MDSRLIRVCHIALMVACMQAAMAASVLAQDGVPLRFNPFASWFRPDVSAQAFIEPLIPSDSGVGAEAVYTGEVWTNARGGRSTDGATRYGALLDLGVELDFEQASCELPGRIFMLAQNTHGQGLTETDVGDTQVISNIDGFTEILQVSELWWEFTSSEKDLRVRWGKQDINTEFLLMPTAGAFIHSSFGLSPSAGLPSFPHPSLAAVVMAQVRENVQLKFGVWDGLGYGEMLGFSRNGVIYVAGAGLPGLDWIKEGPTRKPHSRSSIGFSSLHESFCNQTCSMCSLPPGFIGTPWWSVHVSKWCCRACLPAMQQ